MKRSLNEILGIFHVRNQNAIYITLSELINLQVAPVQLVQGSFQSNLTTVTNATKRFVFKIA